MKSKQTKKMVMGAMIASLCGVLSLLNTYTGSLFDLLMLYGMTIFLSWYGYTYDLKSNILVYLSSLFIIFLTSIPTFLIQSITYGLVGLYIGECLRRGASKKTLLFGTFVICLLNNILTYTVFAAIFGINVITDMNQMYDEISTMMTMPISKEMFISFIPFVIALLSFVEMYCINILCQLVFTKLKIHYPRNFHIGTLHFGYTTGLVFLGVILLSVIFMRFHVIANIYCQYGLMIGLLGFVVQGLAFVNYFALIKNLRILVILSFTFLFIPMGMYVYVILGFLDIFTSIRQKI